jgi:hypothetical protein
MIRLWMTLAGAAALGLLPTGCSGSKVCTAIGAASGVVVSFDRGVTPTSGPISIAACVDSKCGTQRYSGPASSPLFVALLSIPSDADVNVSIKVSANSSPVFSGSTHAHTRSVQPNGKSCPPTVWDVDVTAHAGNRLSS